MVSNFDEFADLVREFYPDLAPAKLVRVVPGVFDPINGKRTSAATTQEIACLALADTRTTKAANGALTTTTKLTLTVEPHEGDTLKLGVMSYVLSDCAADAPDGVPLIFYAVGKQ